MIRAVDPAGGHAHALEQQADNEDQRQQLQGTPPAFALTGMQEGEAETGQRDQRGEVASGAISEPANNGIGGYEGIQAEK